MLGNVHLAKKKKKKKRKKEKKKSQEEEDEVVELPTLEESRESNNTTETEGVDSNKKKKKKRKKTDAVEIYIEGSPVQKSMKEEILDDEIQLLDDSVPPAGSEARSKNKKKRKKEDKENFTSGDLEKSLKTERNKVLRKNLLTPSPRKKLFTPTATPQLFDEVRNTKCSKSIGEHRFHLYPLVMGNTSIEYLVSVEKNNQSCLLAIQLSAASQIADSSTP